MKSLESFAGRRGQFLFLSALLLAVIFTITILLGGFGKSLWLMDVGVYGMMALFAIAITILAVLVIWRFALEGVFNWVRGAWRKTPTHIQLTLVVSVLIALLVLIGLAIMFK